MKKILISLLLLSSLCFADQSLIASALADTDTMAAVSGEASTEDTVNIGEIVRSQIEAAQMSSVISSVAYGTPKETKPEIPVKVEKKQEKTFVEELVFMLNDFNRKYSNVLIFLVSSVFILSIVLGRRVIKGILFGSKSKLKKAINLIRTEEPMHRENKKLELLRKTLSDSSNIFDISEGKIAEKAKGLNVGTGEIILAAKIKAFQLSKVLNR